jgi:hypothetical protein
VYRQLKKYRPFVRVDPDNIKKIMRQVFLSWHLHQNSV